MIFATSCVQSNYLYWRICVWCSLGFVSCISDFWSPICIVLVLIFVLLVFLSAIYIALVCSFMLCVLSIWQLAVKWVITRVPRKSETRVKFLIADQNLFTTLTPWSGSVSQLLLLYKYSSGGNLLLVDLGKLYKLNKEVIHHGEGSRNEHYTNIRNTNLRLSALWHHNTCMRSMNNGN